MKENYPKRSFNKSSMDDNGLLVVVDVVAAVRVIGAGTRQ
jgi:hypothetical protein